MKYWIIFMNTNKKEDLDFDLDEFVEGLGVKFMPDCPKGVDPDEWESKCMKNHLNNIKKSYQPKIIKESIAELKLKYRDTTISLKYYKNPPPLNLGEVYVDTTKTPIESDYLIIFTNYDDENMHFQIPSGSSSYSRYKGLNKEKFKQRYNFRIATEADLIQYNECRIKEEKFYIEDADIVSLRPDMNSKTIGVISSFDHTKFSITFDEAEKLIKSLQNIIKKE